MSADLFALARTLAVLKYLADKQIAGRQDEVTGQALDAMPPTTRLPVQIAGQTVATVTVPTPSKRCKVTSPLKFLAWVQEHRPGEVEMVPTVRQAFDSAVKAAVKEHGGWLDKETGEYMPVPGLEQATGDPYVKVELNDAAGPAIAAAWRTGTVDLGAVLALPAGEEESDA